MEFFRGIVDAIADLFNPISRAQLNDFQKRKLVQEFNMFYDRNKDGLLQWKDFEMARQHICTLSGWKEGSPKYKVCQELFTQLWRNLQDMGDTDTDGEISIEEWLKMWTGIYRDKLQYERHLSRKKRTKKDKSEEETQEEDKDKASEDEKDESASEVDWKLHDKSDDFAPEWLENYITYKFYLYDRAGDGVVDAEEFEYTLSDGFNIPGKDCRSAFTLFSESGQKKVDKAYFRQLALDYYLSPDVGALGNFINGKLVFD